MKQYHDLLKHVLDNGIKKEDRTGTGTLSVFGYEMRFDLQDGFPLVTTKQVNYAKVLGELLWFLSGSINANECADKFNVHFWKKWADEDGNLGPVYGFQWRNWGGADYEGEYAIDQIYEVIKSIKETPDSRRHIVSAWNTSDIEFMKLPPCHLLFQFYVAEGKLSCKLTQRSADCFLGIPYNIASYATLIHMVANVTGLKVGEFIHSIGDAHIYLNHVEQVKEQLQREERKLPQLEVAKLDDIDAYHFEHFKLVRYDPHPAIKGEVSV